ncbi:ATP-binding protein [Chloroflexota bacterium]
MTGPISSPLYIAPPLVTLIVNLVLIFLVWRSGRRNFSNRLFVLCLISMAVWSFLLLGMRASSDLHKALLWEKATTATTFSSFLFFYHFSITYGNIPKSRRLLPFAYLFLIIIIAVSPTRFTIESMRLEYYGYAPNIGLFAYPAFLGCILLIAGSVYNLLKTYRASFRNEERNRLIYLIVGVVVVLIGIFLDGLSNLPPIAVWTNMLFCIISSIAIIKYHLLDIRLAAKTSLVYVLVSAIVALPISIVLILGSSILETRTGPWWWYLLLITILSTLLRPSHNWAQNIIDRLFSRGRYDQLKELQDFSQEPRKLSDVSHIGYPLVRLINNALHSSSCHLLLPVSPDRFEVVSTIEEEIFQLRLSINSSLLRWLRNNKTILHRQDLYVIPQLQPFISTENEELRVIKPELFVPLLTMGQEVIGVIILGEKLSQQLYSPEDESLLMTVANRMAIELDNSRLYGEMRQVTSSLRDSEEKLRRIFESVTDTILVADLNLNILDCNDVACTVAGCPSKDMILGKNLIDFISPVERNRVIGDVQSIFKEEAINNIEGIVRKVDGTEFPAEAGASVLHDGTGKSIGFVVIVRDITERRQMEKNTKEFEQKAYTASRLATVGEMSAGIAHEINNPLTGVLGFSELLLQQEIPEEIKKNVEIINNGAQRVSEIVSRLLTFARQQKPVRSLVDINDIVRSTLELRTYNMNVNNIKVNLELEPNIPNIAADGGQLQQVFLNLILNAETEMKLAHNRGTLIIKTETVNSFIRISFTDDGPGISEENMKRLFEPFFTNREVGQGTGLGLSICYGIISEHDGIIYAENNDGKGATFIVELPIVTV